MAVAEIIGAAVGTLLLITVAYLLVGNVLATSEIVVNAQKDLTSVNEIRLRTDITIESASIWDYGVDDLRVNFSVRNTGNEILSDFEHTDVYTHYIGQDGYQHYTYDKENPDFEGKWAIQRFENDYIHPNELDPGELMWCSAKYTPGNTPIIIQISTNNGVFASKQIS